MRKALIIVFELVLVALSVYIADQLQQQISFIPKSIIHLPEVDYSDKDFRTIYLYFMAIHGLVFCIAQYFNGQWRNILCQKNN